jgi:hypothetical protein
MNPELSSDVMMELAKPVSLNAIALIPPVLIMLLICVLIECVLLLMMTVSGMIMVAQRECLIDVLIMANA